MQITISEESRELLLDLLQIELGEVRQEIHHTKTYEYRDKLKVRESVIRELIAQLNPEAVQA
ncbi:MAG: hypothetical protein R3E79_15275 [Caldilineaceae bacterium]